MTPFDTPYPTFNCSAYAEGVPQGSVLGPILFVLYTAEIGRIVARYGLGFHQYADDCQIYVATSVTTAHSAVDQLSRCVFTTSKFG